ncbi:hypothetical protein AMS68_005216 [Peltaster fructicola]|uniref:Tuberous sclerosis 1 n=1 Tax=Peltaster fructicola TaxID=286661 RepID=A0A6H0XYK0_9PEZI|nr:hypothetical protein AMS68_005216 [Peltaster fructicola]
MSSRSIKDATKALQHLFSAAKVPSSLPNEARRMLEQCVDEHDSRISEHDATTANQHLRTIWEKYVSNSPSKLGAFTGVLKALQPAITSRTDVFDWWQLVIRPVFTSTSQKKPVYDDAHDFLVNVMLYDENETDSNTRASLANRLARELFNLYITRSRIVEAVNREADVAETLQIAQRAETVLIAFGKKHPKDFCQGIDELVQTAGTRVAALTILGSFLKHQIPHLYLVSNTPLVGSLLKCLMNDTSTTVLTIALNDIIMILPHIPSTLRPHLPRLFLVYSRLLCWEKFSPLSTADQKNLVMDDRLFADTDDDLHDIGIDRTWEKFRPQEGTIEASTPEVRTYFTFLYGLYPLNFMNYIRKPRKYLKALNFPGADDFDLDQTVIRSRSDQFRELHRVHPNFYHFTIEEELEDPKWIKTDPSDVVAECHGLIIRPISPAASPGPPPSRKLPELPAHGNGLLVATSGRTSPTHSVASLRNDKWRGGAESDGLAIVSPVSRPTTANSNDDRALYQAATMGSFPAPPIAGNSEGNIAYLQRQITLLTNELNFEKWHKAQYSQHISQLARKNVKDATAEAETLNLINANRALKQQIEQIRSAREASIKDSALTRKQATNTETHMMDRFRTMKKEQEAWMVDTTELQRLRDETAQYRDLLVAAEAREVDKIHELEILQRDLEQLQSLREQLKEANKRIREYEYRDFEFERSKRDAEILKREKDTMMMKLQRQEQDAERSHRAMKEHIAELEARSPSIESFGVRPPASERYASHSEAEANAKLSQLKKAYAQLLSNHTELQVECQTLRSRLEMLADNNMMRSPQAASIPEGIFDFGMPGREQQDHTRLDTMSSTASRGLDSAYDSYGEYSTQPEPAVPAQGHSEPTNRRFGTQRAESFSRPGTVSSRASTQLVMYNQTAPLDDMASIRGPVSESSGETAKERKQVNKIQPTSEVRVYGRGGAQNIKLKTKDKKEKTEQEKPRSGFRGFRNIM